MDFNIPPLVNSPSIDKFLFSHQPHLYSAASISDGEGDDDIYERGSDIDWNENQDEANQFSSVRAGETVKMDSSHSEATDSLLEGKRCLILQV